MLKLRKEVAITFLVDMLFFIVFFVIVGSTATSLYKQYPEISELTEEKISRFYETDDIAGLEVSVELIQEVKSEAIRSYSLAGIFLIILWIISRLIAYRTLSGIKFSKKIITKFSLVSLVTIVGYVFLMLLSFKFLNLNVFYWAIILFSLIYMHFKFILLARLSLGKDIKSSEKLWFKKDLVKPYLVFLLVAAITVALVLIAANLPYMFDMAAVVLILLLFVNLMRNYIFLTIKNIKA